MREDYSSEHRSACQPADVAAYLDGELDPAASILFEQHARQCPECAALLTEQKRLLCLFDAAFRENFERKFDLPKNFAEVVTAHAQSDMTGVLRGPERRRALVLCALLAVGSFSLLGTAMFGAALAPMAAAARLATSVAGMLGHAVAGGGSGASAILRPIGGQFFGATSPFRFLTWMLLACAVLLLLGLIARYHRGGARIHEQ